MNYLKNKTLCPDCKRFCGVATHVCVVKESLPEKFLKRVLKTDGCWLWQGAKYGNGYGCWMGHQGDKKRLAHRMSYELFVGKIPAGMMICHKCDVRNCVNPEHLHPETQKFNMQDMINKGRRVSYVRHGDKNPSAKLTWEQVREIRNLHRSRTYKQLAEQFGIGKSMVGNIVTNQAWHENQ